MSRRTFLIFAILLGAAGMLGIVILPSFDKVIKNILSNDLDFLKVKEESFDRFIRDAEEKKYWKSNFYDKNKILFIRVYYYLNNQFIDLPYKFKYLQLRERIVGDFLLATNFFQNKMDESAEVRYLRLYNPYLAPCSNPFSNLYYPGK